MTMIMAISMPQKDLKPCELFMSADGFSYCGKYKEKNINLPNIFKWSGGLMGMSGYTMSKQFIKTESHLKDIKIENESDMYNIHQELLKKLYKHSIISEETYKNGDTETSFMYYSNNGDIYTMNSLGLVFIKKLKDKPIFSVIGDGAVKGEAILQMLIELGYKIDKSIIEKIYDIVSEQSVFIGPMDMLYHNTKKVR